MSEGLSPFSSLSQLRKALDKKQISSGELTDMYVFRLENIATKHNAVAQMTAELATKQAGEADERISKGRAKGPLDGIPFGVKDLLATKGIPTRWGSPGHADQVFDHDATPVTRLQDAGGVLVAKLEMIELAGGGNYNVADASRMGPCASAWDMKRWAGGSSSGSGASTALGCVGYSLGSETSGSIVCPSAFNGCTGFRPTYGRVSRYGAMALCWTLDRIGPIARSAEDAALVLTAIAGYDPRDPSTVSQKMSLREKGPKPRIGLIKSEFKDSKAEVCKKAYHDTIENLRKQGYETAEIEYPDMPYNQAVDMIVNAEGTSAHENFIRSDRFQLLKDINQVAGFAAALETRAIDYLWAMRLRTEALRANAVWEKCDCIFTPVFYHAAPAIDKPFDQTWNDMGGDNGPSNLLGWPCMAFPIGFEDGAPLGGQIIAPCLREDISFRVARDFQRHSDWHLKHPAA